MNNIDDIVKEQLQNHEYSFSKEYWAPVGAGIEVLEATRGASGIAGGWITYTLIGLVTTGLGVCGYWGYKSNCETSDTKNNTAVGILVESPKAQREITTKALIITPSEATVANEPTKKNKLKSSKKSFKTTSVMPVAEPQNESQNSIVATSAVTPTAEVSDPIVLTAKDQTLTPTTNVDLPYDSTTLNVLEKKAIVPIAKPNKPVFRKTWFSRLFKKQ
jgi:hypothetical protein